ncbi:MAG TPA: hypothetical protein VE077_13470 [Candidatus Methylomirabilis sp.]|nr:hypothetical protein [Candidatus Methylomirabilis sp.]
MAYNLTPANPHTSAATTVHSVTFLAVLAAAHIFGWNGAQARQKEGTTSETVAAARPCQAGSDAEPGKKRKPGKKKETPAVAGEPGCLEVHATVIEVQEYLQQYVREQRWDITNEKVAEDAWTFYMQLEKEEIPKYAKPEAGEEHVIWTGGQAYVQAETSEIDDGYTRLQVKVRIDAYGQSRDRFAPQKKSRELASSGALETNLAAALAAHMNSKH